MQTFLPYPDFDKSAQCLDYRRLGKQRVEAKQLYNIISTTEIWKCSKCKVSYNLRNVKADRNKFRLVSTDNCPNCKTPLKKSTAWRNHPAALMWKKHEAALAEYHDVMLNEWVSRGYKNNMPLLIPMYHHRQTITYPKWLGDENFHASHRSNLLRKDSKYYSQFNWNEPDNLEYIWPH